MARHVNTEIAHPLNQLIRRISPETSTAKRHKLIEKVLLQIQHGEVLPCEESSVIEARIRGMAEKFRIHGFASAGDSLVQLHRQYTKEAKTRLEAELHRSLVFLMLELSQSPVQMLADNVDQFGAVELSNVEANVDWSQYLLEGSFNNSTQEVESDSWSDLSSCEKSVDSYADYSLVALNVPKQTPSLDIGAELNAAIAELTSMIHPPFRELDSYFDPSSTHSEANSTSNWSDYVFTSSYGLLKEQPTILSEYMVLREIFWEFHTPNTCNSFEITSKGLELRKNIALSSLRRESLETVLQQYLQWFRIVDELRQYILKEFKAEWMLEPNSPLTFQAYAFAVADLLQPIMDTLVELEMKVTKQDGIFSLLSLTEELSKSVFPRLMLLYRAHRMATSSHRSSSTLLGRLFRYTISSSTSAEANLHCRLYLASLKPLLAILRKWSVFGELDDPAGELRSALSPDCVADPLMKLVSRYGDSMGRNLDRLKQLKQLHRLQGTGKDLHAHLMDLLLLDRTPEQPEPVQYPQTVETELMFDESLVDASDFLLMEAFRLQKNPKGKVKMKKEAAQVWDGSSMLLLGEAIENALEEVVSSVCLPPGSLLKRLVVEEHDFAAHLKLIDHLFLFQDGLTHQFYRVIFDEYASGKVWHNFFYLMCRLQDCLSDLHPRLCRSITVDVHANAGRCFDFAAAAACITVSYNVAWPVDLIVGSEQLSRLEEIFRFVLTLKWALYVLEHSAAMCAACPLAKYALTMRFILLNSVNLVHHCFLGDTVESARRQLASAVSAAHDLDAVSAGFDAFCSTLFNWYNAVNKNTRFNENMLLISGLKRVTESVKVDFASQMIDLAKICNASFQNLDSLLSV